MVPSATHKRKKRPLSNTENNLGASEEAGCCSAAQFGFVAERQLGDVVLLLEPSAIQSARRLNDGGLIFVDVRAASPSMRLERVLDHLHLPAPICCLLDSFNRGTYATISMGAAVAVKIHMPSGIRQGRPASGSVLPLAIDRVLRRLVSSSPSPCNQCVAFVDGAAAYLHRCLAMVQGFVQQLADVARALGLVLAPANVVVIPLRPEDVAKARAELVGFHSCPRWKLLMVSTLGLRSAWTLTSTCGVQRSPSFRSERRRCEQPRRASVGRRAVMLA